IFDYFCTKLFDLISFLPLSNRNPNLADEISTRYPQNKTPFYKSASAMASILRFAKHARSFSDLTVASRRLSTLKYCLTKHGKLPKREKLKQVQIWTLASRSISVQKVQTDYQRVDDALNRLDMFARRSGKISMKAVEQLLEDFKQLGKVNPNHSLLAIHCCGKLLCDEKFETRSKLTANIWNFLETSGSTLDISHYNALIKVYFENEHKFNPTDFLAKIESKGLTPNRVTYQRLISCYCQQGDIEGAGKILEHMKKEAIPINEGVFNALILGHARTNNMEGAKGVLDVMRNAKVQPSVDTYAALLNAYAEKGDIESISQGLGCTFGSIISPLIEHYVNKGQLDNALSMVRLHNVRININKLFSSLSRFCFEPSTSIDAALDLLQLIKDRNLMETSIDVFGQFALSYGRYVHKSTEKMEFVLKKMLSRDVRISPEMRELMHKHFHLNNSSPISHLLNKMAMDMDDIETPVVRQQLQSREMNLVDMERNLDEARKRGMNTKSILSKLLLHHCRAYNVEKAEEIKAELDALDFVYPEGISCVLMNMYANCDKLDDAKAIWTQVKEKHPDVAIDELKLLDFSAALVRADEVDEAIKFLSEQSVTKLPVKKDSSVFRLLNSAAEKGNEELTKKLFDIVIQRVDLKAAVDKFFEICRNYRTAPWRDMLLEEFVKIDDADTVQKIINECSAIYGEMNTMYDLAFAFLRCGRSREAKKLFDTCGVRARHGNLDHECQRLIEKDDVGTLEELVKVTRDLFDINRDRMYYHLLQAYDKRNDHENALDVWTLMQEEDVRPSERTLVFLANILKRNDRSVPFAVPEVKVESTATSSKSPIQKAINENDVGSALKIYQANKLNNRTTTEHETRVLIEGLVQKERLRDAVDVVLQTECDMDLMYGAVRLLLTKLASNGDTDNIKKLETKFTPSAKKRVQFNNTMINSYISKDEPLNVLKMMEDDLQGDRSNPPGGVLLPFLKKYPQLVDKVEELAVGYSKHNAFNPLNYVWMYYFVNENYGKADAIFKQTPDFQEKLSFRYISDHALLVENVDMLKRLLDVVKSTKLPSQAVAKVASTLIDVQCALNELDGAEATYKDAKSADAEGFINLKSVNNLRTKLRSVGKDCSFLPSQSSSSSSSDSSDSDAERESKKSA
uniref:Pentacotripeptide-repeat region of PRORP domain-containing protein n=1 Tax=Strigamia maritima TaxID=126957 RepID=T1IYE6_STRMM